MKPPKPPSLKPAPRTGPPPLPTRAVEQFSEARINEAVIGVFKRFGRGPFEIDAVIHFALEKFPETTPTNYTHAYSKFTNYIMEHFETLEATFTKKSNSYTMMRILVYYSE